VNDNPWHRLPDSKPFVLPDEEKAIRDFNKKAGPKHLLHIDEILPEAFVGDPGAPVVILGNNPGFTEKGASRKQQRGFMDRLRANLLHQRLDYPFVYLDPDIGEPHKWWERKLKHLIDHFEKQTVARAILAVEHFPYPSRKYGHRSLSLPSQEYNFRLVRKAMDRGAVIVLMRGRKRWFESVEKLKGYPHLVLLKNVQQPTISPKNCRDGGYQEIVRAIEAEFPSITR
jgi:hypothetical protein